jgi:hypothetical protein
LVESFNSMVRKSYLKIRQATRKFWGPREVRTPDPMAAKLTGAVSPTTAP